MKSDKQYTQSTMVRSAGVFGIVTMFSRVLGLVRDRLFAGLFGTSIYADAFVIAFTIPNMFRMLLGEGALSGAFIPVFTKKLHDDGEDSAWLFANRVLTLLSVVMIVFIVTVCLVLGTFLFFDISYRLREIIILSLILLPYMFFICNVGLLMGILNTFYHFFLPAFAPVILNIVLIIALLALQFGHQFQEHTQIVLVSFAVLLGGSIQFLSHIIAVNKKGMKYRFSMKISPGIKQVWLLMLPALIGLSITQINLVVDRLLAVMLGTGVTSCLYYSNRFIQLPIGVFGVAIATASFPLLARHASADNTIEFKRILSQSLKMTFLIALPATAGLIVMSYPVVRMLFEHKQFDAQSSHATAFVLSFYCLGLVGYCSNKVIIRAFYSLHDTVTPMRIGIVGLIINVVLNLILMIPLKGGGLALSTSITSVVSLLIYGYMLRRKIGTFLTAGFYRTIINSLICSLIMGAFVYGTLKFLEALVPPMAIKVLITGLVPVLMGGGFYLGLMYLFNREEVLKILEIFKLRRKRA